ncbi:PEPxxWA-CTERM sorting domain-containing protein [Phenylobacterium sp.]|uniref:PEPxxWA-CTERM sorting domain-containing protein n=1 Tax=Phenylobacterium sp. TaxID=1871053 RepID=UPI0025D14A73|nr:PEPxxWA-CTERM sorting domain-containing protein [Phenylobacterium sp.]
MVSKMTFLGLAGAFALLQATAAHATLLDWSYTAANGTMGGGTFTADQDLVDPAIFHLTSVTGTIDGLTILGLSGYDGADNQVYATSPVVVDTAGIAFDVGGGLNFNIYEDFGNFPPPSPYACAAHYCIEGPAVLGQTAGAAPIRALDALNITVHGGGAAVPEPASWALMLMGFGGLGAAIRTRRKLGAA